MASINKEQVSEILKSMHPKNNDDPVDKYTELLKTVSNNQSSGIDPTLMLLMGNNNSNKSLDKLYEMVALKQTLKMLGDDDSDKHKDSEITALIKSINDSTDKKLEALQNSFAEQIKAMMQLMPKPESEETKLLKIIASKLENADKKGNTDEVDKLVKLLSVIQSEKPAEKDPIESFSKMYEMVNKGNEKYIGLKEDLLQQQNDATMQQLNQALQIIDQQKNNSDWLGELRKSTSTINQFKSFMEDSGLKPAPKSENGKVDLKYILDTVSDVVKNIAPNLPPPTPKPSWDLDKEARSLYTKYKDILGDEKGNPLTVDFVKKELQKNPNVENIWQAQIKQAMDEQGMDNPDIPEPKNTDEQIKKMFENLDNKPSETTANTETVIDEEQTTESRQEQATEKEKDDDTILKGKHIKGMSA